MKFILSPAKSLDFDRSIPEIGFSRPPFMEQSNSVMNTLVSKKPEELKSLMKISDKLADLNWERNQSWHADFSSEESRAAIYAFTGDVYQGLDIDSLTKQGVDYLQKNLMILSGLYGICRPLDAIMPYRLEMGTKLGVDSAKNLYEFWKPSLTSYLEEQLESDDFVVNLASNEYSKAINLKSLSVPVITPHFKDFKDGKLKMISFYAKKARGMMLRHLAENNADSLDTLKAFNTGGYAFDASLSDETNYVFTR